jgi:hypothetical protein
MTGSEVERTQRTASRRTSVPSVAATALMPTSRQTPEQRTGRHAGRTGSRWGLRTLVIGGLAGAAWLLTGAAAHAADRAVESGSGGLSIVSGGLGNGLASHPLVNGLGTGAVERNVSHLTAAKPVTHVLTAAAKPSKQEDQRHGTRQLTSLVAPATQLVATVTGADDSTDDAGVPGVVRQLTAPLRLAGGPVGATRIIPVTSAFASAATPLTRTLLPVSGLPLAVAPVTTAPGPAHAVMPTEPVLDTTSAIVPAGINSESPTGAASADRVVQPPAAPAAVGVTAGSDSAGSGQFSRNIPRRLAAADQRRTATTVRPVSAQQAPDPREPAPLQVQFGAISGVSTSGSGSPTDGGCAVVPAAIVASSVACRRLPIAKDVEVRRYDAESPTVSPD